MRSLLLSDDAADELDCATLDAELALLMLAKLDMLEELSAATDDAGDGLVPPEPPPHALIKTKAPHTDTNRTHTEPLLPIAIHHLKKFVP